MSQYSRRSIVIGGLTVALAGCVATSSEDDPNQTDDEDDTDDTMPSSTDDDSSTNETEDSGDTDTQEVPEGIALMNPLPDLVEADDRAAFASNHDLDYQNGTVHVEIELVPDGERPDRYLAEVTSEYSNVVVAYVAVDDLVALAQDENVHFVRTPSDPQPN